MPCSLREGGGKVPALLSFMRVERKYRISLDCKEALLSALSDRLVPDAYGKSTVCNFYLDTPDSRIIRASLDAVAFKEKLRLRTYGAPRPEGVAFLEIKRKYNGVVYKRRIQTTCNRAMDYFASGRLPGEGQIMREIDYAMQFYGMPQPKVFLCYEREAFFVRDCPALRLTFDTDVRYRATDLFAGCDTSGKTLLLPGEALLEFKTDAAMPRWMLEVFRALDVRPASFSKYGRAYADMLGYTADLSPSPKGEYTYDELV